MHQDRGRRGGARARARPGGIRRILGVVYYPDMTESGVRSKQGIVLLTGATGYLGEKVLQRLIASGRKVRCLVLPSDEKDPSRLYPCEVVRGDLSEPKGLDSLLEGVDTILHSAALMPPNDSERIRAVNVGGTAALVDKARAEGVRRFIYLSAVSAIYPIKNAYGRSKAEAEALVAASGLDFTILRLTMLYGDGGGLHFAKPSGSWRRSPSSPRSWGPAVRLQPVYVDDVVRAVERPDLAGRRRTDSERLRGLRRDVQRARRRRGRRDGAPAHPPARAALAVPDRGRRR